MEVEPIQYTRLSGQYYSTLGKDGKLRCSCGRALVKLDKKTYQCPGGFPVYRFEEGDVIKDKFGNLLLKMIPHE